MLYVCVSGKVPDFTAEKIPNVFAHPHTHTHTHMHTQRNADSQRAKPSA